MKGKLLLVAVSAVAALVVGCAHNDGRGGMGSDNYRDGGRYESSEAYPYRAQPGLPEVNDYGVPKTQAPGGVGLGEPR